MPAWVCKGIVLFWLGFLATIAGRHLFRRLSGLLVLLLVSLFLSLAIEPGVNRLSAAVGGAARRRPSSCSASSARSKTVTIEHVAGVAVRHPEMVAAGRHYGCKVETCVPYDPESKGGSESTVKVAKRDLVPTERQPASTTTRTSPPWRRRATCSASRSTPGRTARPAGRRSTCSAEEARPPPRAAGRGPHRRPGRDPRRRRRPDRPLRLGALLDPRRPPGRRGVVPGGGRGAGHRRPRRERPGRGGPPPPVHARPPPDRRRPLSPTTPAATVPGRRGSGPGPRPRSPSAPWAKGPTRWLVEAAAVGAARVRTKMAQAVELAALVGAGAGRGGARAGRGGRALRRRRPGLDPRPPRPRAGPAWSSSPPTRPTPPSPAPAPGTGFGQ